MVCVALIVGILTFPSQTSDFPPFPWGTPLTLAEKTVAMDFVGSEGVTERYRPRIDSVADAGIEECTFEFVHGRFSGVTLMTLDRTDTRRLLSYLTRKYGSVRETEPRFWQWLSGESYISLDEDSDGNGYVLWYGMAWQGQR
jgi:hypothetical protein